MMNAFDTSKHYNLIHSVMFRLFDHKVDENIAYKAPKATITLRKKFATNKFGARKERLLSTIVEVANESEDADDVKATEQESHHRLRSAQILAIVT